MGVPEERIFEGTPFNLKPYDEAYKINQKIEDERMWMHNQYTYIAVLLGVGKALWGRKSKGEYPKKPFLQEYKEDCDSENLTEDQKKEQRKKLLTSLQIMQKNFEINHKNT